MSKSHVRKLTIVVSLLKVHVDDTTAEDSRHLVTIESSGFLEDTVGSTAGQVAAVLGEEDGDRVVGEESGLGVIARLLHGALAAPGVDVVAPEVNGVGLVTAVEVVGHLGADIDVVVGGIADTHPAVLLGLDVGLGVTNSGLDESRGSGVVLGVGDLVTGEEADDVGVLLHLVDHGRVAGVQVGVPAGGVSVDGHGGLAQIREDVDAGSLEQGHAGRVVGRGVDGVGSDHVGAELLQQRDITLAVGLAGQRVDEGGVARGAGGAGLANILLVRNTLDEELGAVGVEELGALHVKSGRLAVAPEIQTVDHLLGCSPRSSLRHAREGKRSFRFWRRKSGSPWL